MKTCKSTQNASLRNYPSMASLKGFASILVTVVSILPALVFALADPCAQIGGKTFAPPADVLACVKSFPFNETLRQNVLTNVARVFDFYTFENYYLYSPPPFQESTIDIRAALARINTTYYAVSVRIFRTRLLTHAIHVK
jgi:hypothetical protein